MNTLKRDAIVFGLGCLLLAGAWAQDGGPRAEPAKRPENRGRVLFIDVPVPLIPGQEPKYRSPGPQRMLPSGTTQAAARDESIAEYADTVAELERQGGAWEQGLTEQLVALGRLHQQQGDHGSAVDVLSRALHVNRINQGLHTIEQVPVVEAMIDSYQAMGNWGEVDLYQNYLYFVQRRAYGPEDPRIIPVLARLGRWHLEAFTLGFGDPLGVRLSSAQLLFSAATRMVGTHFGRDDERYITYLRNVARSAYLVSLNPQHMAEMTRPEYRSSQDTLRDQLAYSATSSQHGYVAGEQALEEIIAYYRERGDAPFRLAEAIANLADWQLMYERRNTAQDLYQEAWALLAEQDDSAELIRRLFGQVVPIPTFAELPTNLLLGSSEGLRRPRLRMDTIDVRLEVTQYGAPRNLEVLTEETEANQDQFARLRREIRDTVFRPLIVNGVPQDSGGHLFRYRYWY